MITALKVALLLLNLVMVLWFLYGIWRRNDQVHEYRGELIQKAFDAANRDIARDRPWRWRYDVLTSVGYGRMVVLFWRPLDSFYPDRSFIDPEATGPNRLIDW